MTTSKDPFMHLIDHRADRLPTQGSPLGGDGRAGLFATDETSTVVLRAAMARLGAVQRM